MPIAATRACTLSLTLGLLHGIAGGPPGLNDLVWYVASGKGGRTDGANALYETARRQGARTPNS